jgi:N-acetyl-anhydromuramyl-L-alanine amidase AmpD
MSNEIPRREKNLYTKKEAPALRDMTDKEHRNFVRGLNTLPTDKIKGKHYDYWLPADSSNYTKKSKGDREIRAVVIHTTEGWRPPFNTFRKKNRNASTHYSVEKDGSVVYMVDEKNIAWHGGSKVNDWSIGIEVTGFAVHNGKSAYTHKKQPIGLGMKQVNALAKLVANICKRNKIPLDRNHIFGHAHTGGCKKDPNSRKVTVGNPALNAQAGGGTCHHDPGNDFPWKRFIRLVKWYYYRTYIIGAVGFAVFGFTGLAVYGVFKKLSSPSTQKALPPPSDE